MFTHIVRFNDQFKNPSSTPNNGSLWNFLVMLYGPLQHRDLHMWQIHVLGHVSFIETHFRHIYIKLNNSRKAYKFIWQIKARDSDQYPSLLYSIAPFCTFFLDFPITYFWLFELRSDLTLSRAGFCSCFFVGA